jgi:hypothetical protein
MDHKQTIAMLTWINQVDPRVMLNEANVEVWAYAMSQTPPDVAKQAVLEHYKANEGIAASPGAISKRAVNIKNSREAKNSALTALPPARDPNSWRSRNPELWDELAEQGRQARENDLRAKGLWK